jgi:NAD(P)-dependent dehydrogenase (short-subunit alcohol dehydrogenase family)
VNYLDNLFNLKNKVILVTGACGQLGSEICKAFVGVGSIVVGVDLSVDNKQLDGVDYYELDTTNKTEKQKIYEAIFKKYSSIDVLVNNAGVSTFEDFEQRTEDAFDWVVDVNLKSVFYDIQTYVNLFDKHGGQQGSIINIGSTYGVVSPDFRNYTDLPRKNSEVYGATKAGVIQMTKYFSVHLADRNIRVNCVSPGGILNPDNPQGEDFQKNYNFRTPMKRMANTVEMVGAVLYLAGDSASYTTGQNIIIDGGFTTW